MTYNVQVGNGGYLGWKLLQRTLDTQQSAFSRSTELQRSRDYFTENISTIRSAEDLVSNYKLLSVALRAFGLDDDLNNRFFIRKVLEADPQDKTSLVNRLRARGLVCGPAVCTVEGAVCACEGLLSGKGACA